MENIKTKRNWSEYNKKLKSCVRLELYIHKDIYENWHYVGKRSGGKLIYADAVIEMWRVFNESVVTVTPVFLHRKSMPES
jgi:hypothetical protein